MSFSNGCIFLVDGEVNHNAITNSGYFSNMQIAIFKHTLGMLLMKHCLGNVRMQ